MQHSLWVAEIGNSTVEVSNSKFSNVPSGVISKQFSFRKIWQGKVSQTAASKVLILGNVFLMPFKMRIFQWSFLVYFSNIGNILKIKIHIGCTLFHITDLICFYVLTNPFGIRHSAKL